MVKNDKAVVAVPDEPGVEVMLFLERLADLGLEVERFDAWQRAGELQQGRWLQATFLLEADLELDEAALRRFGATFDLVERLLEDRVAGLIRTFMNPVGGLAGAGGGESFNDLAWAAVRLEAAGLDVAVVDLGAQYAGHTEALLRDSGVLTASIHEVEESFQRLSSEAERTLNVNLGSGGGDLGLVRGVQACLASLADADLDVLLVAAGTDGLDADGSSSLAYTAAGFEVVGALLGQLAASKGASVLMAGGAANLPDSASPEVWAALFAGFVGAQSMTRALTTG